MVDSEGATITINEGDKVFVGVSAAYTDPDGVQSDFSEIAWSDNAVDCQGGAIFGFHNLKRPDKPKNLRK
ncbi:hypothetical protein GWO25_04960 [Candidatus Saccharibacteria bacterium]|nr:hypothetical protein [Candidatus Saccharibacteria bacterium]NIV04532.1 hypothetical protein [Calditrichia bacterium]